MLRDAKAREIDALTARAAGATALYFVDFTRVGAIDTTALRRQLREQKVSVRVVKNRLALRALTAAGVTGDVAGLLKGPTALVFAADDPVAPARLLREVARKLTNLKVKGVYLDGVVHPAAAFDAIAALPGKAELRAQLVGVLQGPMAELVFCLDGLLADLVYVLDAVKDRNQEPAPAS
ncbi:50S ribosomal protein L10 [candidate division WOR-3 bacterium]|nr:50S ribosomal protein L10 [candidate division WOR-3 bacterium]